MLSLSSLPGRRMAVNVSGFRVLASTEEQLLWPGTAFGQPATPAALLVKSSSASDLAPLGRRQQFILAGTIQPALKDKWTGTIELVEGGEFELVIGAKTYTVESNAGALEEWEGVVAGDTASGGTAVLNLGDASYQIEVDPDGIVDIWTIDNFEDVAPGDLLSLDIGAETYAYEVKEALVDTWSGVVVLGAADDEYTLTLGNNDYSHTQFGGTARSYLVEVLGLPEPPVWTVAIGADEYSFAQQAGELADAAAGLIAAINLGSIQTDVVVFDQTPVADDVARILVGATEYSYTVLVDDTPDDICDGLLAVIAAANAAAGDPHYTFSHIGENTILAVAKSRGVSPAVTANVTAAGSMTVEVQPVVAGIAASAGWTAALVAGAEFSVTKDAVGVDATEVTTDPALSILATLDEAGSAADTAATIAAGIAAAAAADPFYDVTADGADITAEAKATGFGQIVTTDYSGSVGSFSIENDISGRPADTLGEALVELVALAAEDELYTVVLDDDVITLTAVEPGVGEDIDFTITGAGTADLTNAQIGATPAPASVAAALAEAASEDLVFDVTSDGADLLVKSKTRAPTGLAVNAAWLGAGVAHVSISQTVVGVVPDTADDLAAALAAQAVANAEFVVTADDDEITIEARAAGVTATSVSASTTDGDGSFDLVHDVTGAAADVAAIATSGNAIVFAHTVQDGDTLASIITALLALMAADERVIGLPVDGQTDRLTIEARSPDNDYTFANACVNNRTGGVALAFTGSTPRAAVGGTGARVIVLDAVDANGHIGQTVVRLNGTTGVALAGSYAKVLNAWLLASGSGGVPAGNVLVRDAGDTETFLSIEDGDSDARTAFFVVPTGFDLYITRLDASVVADAPVLVKLLATRSPSGVPIYPATAQWTAVNVGSVEQLSFAGAPLGPFRAGDMVMLKAVGAADDEVSGTMVGVLIPAGESPTGL
jgi:hypothetical protein